MNTEGGKKHLSVLSNGYAGSTAYYPRVVSQQVTDTNRIALSDSLQTVISTDIRYQTPGATFTHNSQTSLLIHSAMGESTGSLWMGIDGGNNQFFITMPGQSQIRYDHTINGSSWYRFIATLSPEDGRLDIAILELNELGVGDEIWSTSNFDQGFGAINVTGIRGYEFQVGRPANATSSQHSADFSGLTVATVPEPSTMAALMGLGALGVVIAIRRRRRN